MSFRDRNFAQRFEQMGDLAETRFEEVATNEMKRGWVRYGLSRPPIQMHKLPARLRYTPDYLMSDKFVEVQGLGRDQTLKLKLDKWGALHWWNDLHPVEIFVYDSHNDRWRFVPMTTLDAWLAAGLASLDSFPEAKSYFAFPAGTVFGAET